MTAQLLNTYATLDKIGSTVNTVLVILFILIWIWVMYKYLDTSDLND